MPFEERCEILRGFAGVADTSGVVDDDNTVCEALRRLKPTYFANGGDRKTDNTPEMDVCEELGIEMLWGVGGGKIQSSSTLVSDAGMNPNRFEDDEVQPSKVEIVQSGDIPKVGDY